MAATISQFVSTMSTTNLESMLSFIFFRLHFSSYNGRCNFRCFVRLSAPDAHAQLRQKGSAVESPEKPKQQYHSEPTTELTMKSFIKYNEKYA